MGHNDVLNCSCLENGLGAETKVQSLCFNLSKKEKKKSSFEIITNNLKLQHRIEMQRYFLFHLQMSLIELRWKHMQVDNCNLHSINFFAQALICSFNVDLVDKFMKLLIYMKIKKIQSQKYSKK